MFCAEMERECEIQKYRAQLPWEELGLKWAFGWSWGRWEGERDRGTEGKSLQYSWIVCHSIPSCCPCFTYSFPHSIISLQIQCHFQFTLSALPCSACHFSYSHFTFCTQLHNMLQFAIFSIQTARRNRNKRIRMNSVCLHITHFALAIWI